MGAVLKGECFSQFKNGLRTSSCLYRSKLDRISVQRRAEVTKSNYFSFFKKRITSFIESTSHSWNDKPTQAESGW